ncbi:MAG TPA: hypothetical protein ENN76_00950, partial [Euryarchaeota archaeon]|nr:hypothetical protein [Euryarchaeota archaeon]
MEKKNIGTVAAIAVMMMLVLSSALVQNPQGNASASVLDEPDVPVDVSSPAEGDVYQVGTEILVEWDTSQIDGDQVLIVLYDDGELDYSLFVFEDNTGSYLWDTEYYFSMSDSLQIKVENAYSSINFGYSGIFSVMDIPQHPVEVYLPAEGDEIPIPSKMTVTWNADDIASNYVDIYLYWQAFGEDDVVEYTPNTGIYEFNTPWYWDTGEKYKIKVMDSHDHERFGFSGKFSFISHPLPDDIVVIAPCGGERYRPYEGVDIQWLSPEGMDNFCIDLYQDGRFLLNIFNDYETWGNDVGFFTYYIPYDHQGGENYQIKVSDQNDPSIYNHSGMFSILGSGEEGSLEDAVPLDYDTPTEGSIEWGGRVYYAFDVDETALVTVCIETDEDNPYFSMAAKVLDSDGGVISMHEYGYFWNEFMYVEDMAVCLFPGTYFIELSTWDDGNYEICITSHTPNKLLEAPVMPAVGESWGLMYEPDVREMFIDLITEIEAEIPPEEDFEFIYEIDANHKAYGLVEVTQNDGTFTYIDFEFAQSFSMELDATITGEFPVAGTYVDTDYDEIPKETRTVKAYIDMDFHLHIEGALKLRNSDMALMKVDVSAEVLFD